MKPFPAEETWPKQPSDLFHLSGNATLQTKNPGPIKTCTACGAPQPEDVEFTRVDQETFNFIKDEALIRMA